MMPGVRNRDLSIDLLRFIALVGIILAHVQPTAFWLQLRNFDVPLMVFLSGVSYKMSGGNKLGYASYCVKRFKRLVLPVWIFLPIYFLIYIVATRTLPLLTDVISYYTLLTGWYVWIIRVFFVIALVAPLLSKGLDSLSKRSFLVIVSAFFFLFELFVNSECSAFRGRTMLLTNLPYMVVFAFGYKIIEFSKKSVVGLSLLSASIYVTYFMSIGGGGTQPFKYPPQLYYISYALAWCFSLWIIRERLHRLLGKLPRKVYNTILFIGSHTMWIYLWHIPVVRLATKLDLAILRFCMCFVIATLITYCQNRTVNALSHYVGKPKWQKDLRMIFGG